MSSTSHEQVRGTSAEHMRDEEHCATLTAEVRSKVLEVARNGFAGATAGGESCVRRLFHDVSPHLPPADVTMFAAPSQAPFVRCGPYAGAYWSKKRLRAVLFVLWLCSSGAFDCVSR